VSSNNNYLQTLLKSQRSNWNDALFKALNDAITTAFNDVLGIYGLNNKTKASQELYKVKEEVLPKLTSFKRQVKIDFEDE
jgi:Zn-dependent oligopeptidase